MVCKKHLFVAMIMLCVSCLPMSMKMIAGTKGVGARQVLSAQPIQGLSQIVKKEGWNVPGRKEFESVASQQTVTIDKVECKKKQLQSPVEPITEVELYALDANGRLVIQHYVCAVSEVNVFEVAGKAFAYEVRLIPVSIRPNGMKEYAGARFNFLYVDEEGYGVFKVRYHSSQALDTLALPAWVKQLKTDEKSGKTENR